MGWDGRNTGTIDELYDYNIDVNDNDKQTW